MNLKFFKNKKIFLTGHTGFKGSWLSYILINAGAKVVGFANTPNTAENLFSILKLDSKMISIISDVRDKNSLLTAFEAHQPELVVHLAAQPLVSESYIDPVHTYETNIMGTVNILEAVRLNNCVKSFLNVTTDKVYKKKENSHIYKESDALNGFDPYANSKSCSELITSSYEQSFLQAQHISVSTARSGNIIGGGDFNLSRIIPKCINMATQNKPIFIRNPKSIRPYQHIFESLSAYLLILEKQYNNPSLANTYNIGPSLSHHINTEDLVTLFCKIWGKEVSWVAKPEHHFYESPAILLDSTKIEKCIGWEPKWSIEKAIEKTVNWSKSHLSGDDMDKFTQEQISEFFIN